MSDAEKQTVEYDPQEIGAINVLFKGLVQIEDAYIDMKRAGVLKRLSYPSFHLLELIHDVNGAILGEVKGRLVAHCTFQERYKFKWKKAKVGAQ